MTLKQLRNNNPKDDLLKISPTETTNIWTSDFWDGPLSGLLEYKNELYWFEMTQENEEFKENDWYRRFAILKISKKQLEKELEVHECFQRYVGTHFDGKQLKSPPIFEKGKQNEFYDKHREYVESRPFEDNEVIGWMEN